MLFILKMLKFVDNLLKYSLLRFIFLNGEMRIKIYNI